MGSRQTNYFVVIQIFLWIGILVLPYFMVPPHLTHADAPQQIIRINQQAPNWPEITFLINLPFNFCLLLFFYLHHYVLFDKLVLRRKFALYGALVLSAMTITIVVAIIAKRKLYPELPDYMLKIEVRELIRYLTWFLLVLAVSLGIKLLSQWTDAEQRARAIVTENLRTELAMLHAQINPHFLFNSLNTIYSLSLTKSDKAPLAVLKLSQLLRYVIEDSGRDKVSLEQEITYINNYLELQRLRTSHFTSVNFNIKGDVSSASVAPLLMLPFVENAFKYGISNSEPSPIDIQLERKNGELQFSVSNKKFKQASIPSTGIGISNVQRRLELLYPEKHNLDIQDSEEKFKVHLQLQL